MSSLTPPKTNPKASAKSRRGILRRGGGLAWPATSIREVSGNSKEVGRQARCIIAQSGHRKSPAGERGAKVIQRGLAAGTRQTRRMNSTVGCTVRGGTRTKKPRRSGAKFDHAGVAEMRKGNPLRINDSPGAAVPQSNCATSRAMTAPRFSEAVTLRYST